MCENQKILERIQKLLRQAEGNKFVHEAEVAMLKAQELLAKHHLTMSDVELADAPQKEVVDNSVFESGRMAWWVKSLSVIIAKNFRCQPYTQKRSNTKICFIGLKEDVEVAKEIFLFAVNTVKIQSERYCKQHRQPGMSITPIKNDWITGFINGLRDQFNEQVRTKGYALILVKDAIVEQAIKEKKLRKGQKSHIRVGHNGEARSAGYRQGKNFNGGTSKLIESY